MPKLSSQKSTPKPEQAEAEPMSAAVKARKTRLRQDNYLPYRLSVASNEVSQLIAGAYRDRFGITIPQWRLITILSEGGALTPQELTLRTIMDKVTVCRAAQGLLGRNLVARSPNEKDARSHRLELTELGWQLYGEVAPVVLAFEAALLDGWAPDEVEHLKKQLLRLQRTAAGLARFGFFPTKT